MNKTQVKVYFSLYGEDFPIDEVTERLKVIPTGTYKKGDLIPNRSTNRYRKESSWDLGTDYQDSLDVNKQLQEIVDKLQNKSLTINEIKDAYSLECKFFIVIIIENGNTPTLYLNKEIVKFASSIEAEFDVDLYANPYESNLND
ncbi:DUF4279 domain-containing protein [Lysinibacillus telephonicus]|uniref:DUF4279 domain-containing protein n=1 Tax=Lysinibacillus telephonicus TaxID=1714840 RepID=A0A431UDX7_9BACI|nr:DUF4279 domain-containing protein [Lysinibacillus telephonicus]RTQ87633.1 DUF4279 domain-containing protein [Lysinibacillus telephonicus]